MAPDGGVGFAACELGHAGWQTSQKIFLSSCYGLWVRVSLVVAPFQLVWYLQSSFVLRFDAAAAFGAGPTETQLRPHVPSYSFLTQFIFISPTCLILFPTHPIPIHLQVKFRDYAKAIAETKANMSSDAASAFFSLTQAEYAAGNFKNKVAEGPMTARIRVGAGVDNVAGVKIPVFTLYETGATADNQSLGLVGGGKKIQNVRDKFTNFIEMLIKLASLQTSFVTLDEALKVTNRRVNALENVTIPKIQAVLDYISRELDELEREGE